MKKGLQSFTLLLLPGFLILGACTPTKNTPDLPPEKCEVTFKNYDSTVLFYTSVDYGGTAVYQGDTPERPSTVYYSYEFTGWDKSLENIVRDTTFIAQYRQDDVLYQIDWNIEGTVTTEQYRYGEIPSFKNGTPRKESTAMYSYTFEGWSPEITAVTESKTYYATFSSSINSYSIRWLNDDNSLIQEETYAYGSTPSFKGTTPVKSGDEPDSYIFVGWTPSIQQVTGDASYVATYERILTIQEKYGVTHAGTAEDPLTNEEAITVAKHSAYAEGQEDLYVGGIIKSFYHTPGSRTDGAVSWFLQPAEEGGEKFEVYKCYKEGGTTQAYRLTDDDVWKGGYAIAHGRFGMYNGQCETLTAVFVSCTGNKPNPRTTISTTFAAVLEAGKALDDGDTSWDYYQFDAYVTQKTGSNYYLTASLNEEITDVKTNTIEIYNASADVASLCLKNAKITVKMLLKNYHDQIENSRSITTDDITVLVEGTAWE